MAKFSGNAKSADRRSQLSIRARALRGRGIAGGDRRELALNAAPQTNRLDIQLTLDAPANGLVSGLTGTTKGLHMQIGGKGDWKRWDGSALASLRSEEHTSELQSLMRISYAVFCLNKNQIKRTQDCLVYINTTQEQY